MGFKDHNVVNAMDIFFFIRPEFSTSRDALDSLGILRSQFAEKHKSFWYK